MPTGVDVDIDDRAVHDLGFDDDMEAFLQSVGDSIAAHAQVLAPKLTGAGAASIHAEVTHDDQSAVVEVGWDSAHDYMRFAEDGTEHEPARPFLRPAGDAAHL